MMHVKEEFSSIARQQYLQLMRIAGEMFRPDELERLAPRTHRGPRLEEVNGQGIGALEPLAATEAVAYDFLAKGGKYSRPFITLATYQALAGCGDEGRHVISPATVFPDAVRRTALAIESFHKASLVHDDIEDNDAYRYGQQTIHRAHGVPTAINVGDYLIGMGYRLVSRDAASLGADVATDILDRFADAHLRLSEGQGAELTWRDARNKRLSPREALKIYALKTAPAFEAAMYAGARLAGPADSYAEPIRLLAKHIGIAFQILNDLKDWQEDDDNKLQSGCDVAGGRPTLLLALALEALDKDGQEELLALIGDSGSGAGLAHRVQDVYKRVGVFEKADRLVENYKARAELIADGLRPDAFRQLCYYLIDAILARREPAFASSMGFEGPAPWPENPSRR